MSGPTLFKRHYYCACPGYAAHLIQPEAFASRELSDSTEIGATWHGRLVIGIQQLRDEVDPQVVVKQISEDLSDFLPIRQQLVKMLRFMQVKLAREESRDAQSYLPTVCKTCVRGAVEVAWPNTSTLVLCQDVHCFICLFCGWIENASQQMGE